MKCGSLNHWLPTGSEQLTNHRPVSRCSVIRFSDGSGSLCLRRRQGGSMASLPPTEPERFFFLDDADVEPIVGYGGEHNRRGFAVQLGTVRSLGLFLPAPLDAPWRLWTFLRINCRSGIPLWSSSTPNGFRQLTIMRGRFIGHRVSGTIAVRWSRSWSLFVTRGRGPMVMGRRRC